MAQVFLYYINQRHNIYLNKKNGKPPPWTEDKILQEYKFTNVYRHLDKTSNHFFCNYYKPNENAPADEIALNCAIFRYFGTIELADHVGWQKKFEPERLLEEIKFAIGLGKQVFTGAYVITNSGIKAPKEEVVINRFLTAYNARMDDILLAVKTNNKADVHNVLKTIEGFGGTGFMAKEVMEDMALTPLLMFARDAAYYTPIGPGAARGLKRLYGLDGKLGVQLERIKELRDLALRECNLPMTAHDVQFNLCEFDKYVRVFNGEGRPRSRYKYKEVKGDIFSLHQHKKQA